MSSYSDALSGELKATTLEKSFIRASEPSFKKDEVSSTQLHVLHELLQKSMSKSLGLCTSPFIKFTLRPLLSLPKKEIKKHCFIIRPSFVHERVLGLAFRFSIPRDLSIVSASYFL